jgi:hypothetical protein
MAAKFGRSAEVRKGSLIQLNEPMILRTLIHGFRLFNPRRQVASAATVAPPLEDFPCMSPIMTVTTVANIVPSAALA